MKQLFVGLLLCLAKLATAQDSTQQQKVQFKLGLNYATGLNYYGRTDSLKSTGFFPTAEVWFTRDLYASASPVFVNNAVQSFEYAGTVATLGYLHITQKWISNVYLLKPFYKESSQLVQSALKAQGGASFSRLNHIVNITAGGDIKLSDEIDFGATAGLDHAFRKPMSNGGVLAIDPSFYIYAGTQNFTNTYYKKKTDFLLFPGNSTEVTEDVKAFKILALEFSAPLIYVKGKWLGMITPSFILPQNLIEVPGRPDLSEQGRNSFYATIGIKRTL